MPLKTRASAAGECVAVPRRRPTPSIGICVTLLAWSAAVHADLADDFAREAVFEDVVISPSGKYLAVDFRLNGEEFVGTLDRATLKYKGQISMGEHFGVFGMVWANDERLLIWPAERFPTIDFKAPTGEIVGVDADGSSMAILYGWRAGKPETDTRVRTRESTHGWAEIVDVLPADPNYVMIASHAFSEHGQSSVAARLNVRDGRLITEATSPTVDGEFVCDAHGRVALSYGGTLDHRYALYARTPGSDEFKEVMTRRSDEGRIVPLKAFDASRFLVLDDMDTPTRGLSLWDPATGHRQTVFRHERVDVQGIWLDGSLSVPIAARYVDHFPKYFYPNPDHPLAQVHQSVVQGFPDDDVVFTSATWANDLAVAHVSGDRNPGAFYLVDVKARSVRKIKDARPWLGRERLATMEPYQLIVRDKTPVSVYVTRPDGYKAPGPMVVMVHGGPYGYQDAWGFDRNAQLLAAAGYAVLQVNFRGSGGFGRAFQAAGYREWGRAMQTDVTDATRWAIAEHIADPARICIFGGSYGGYAALTGAFEEPDLYRCAIGYSGVYDLTLLFEKGDIQQRRSGEAYLKEALGDDVAELKARSPAYHAEGIKATVMLVHGRQDERAPIEHAERMRAALKRAGNEPEWIVESGEGHGFFDPKNLADLYRRMLAFLDRNIGAGAAARP